MLDKILGVFFTVVYFLFFAYLIDLIFRNTLSPLANLLAVLCWLIALGFSIGLAGFTVRKIRENYQK